jgi:hypothetical protein
VSTSRSLPVKAYKPSDRYHEPRPCGVTSAFTRGRTIGRIGSGSIDDSNGMTALRYDGPADCHRLGASVFFFKKVPGK